MAAITNLYPPIVDTYMPAFLIDSENISKNICRVYFSLSLFNKITDIQNAQVTVRNQLTNLSILDSDKYPSEIMLVEIQEDLNKETADKYYIEIKPSDIKNGVFENNQYYKVQIRFTSSALDEISLETPQAIDTWLTENLNYFSEWSTVCLIRGISEPELIIKDFAEDLEIPTKLYGSVANLSIQGELSFKDENETDTLNNYNIRLYYIKPNIEEEILIFESGIQNTSDFINTNQINYEIKYDLDTKQKYYFIIDYETRNLYSNSARFNFEIMESTVETFSSTIVATADSENGRIKVSIERAKDSGDDYTNFTGKVIIRRSSNKDNFLWWDDFYTENYKDAKAIKFTWSDYTIENGYWYKYAIQTVNEEGLRSKMTVVEEPVLAVFEDIFLTAEDKQIKIKFNPTVSSIKRVISESRTETLGSKYPFIRRNGDVDYLQFSLGGLIASEMDEEGTFLSKDDEYGDWLENYEQYNEKNRIPFNQIDFIWEKRFRDKVSKFLYNNNVKMYRSPTEGNLLVKLMDISFTPNQTLGRNIQSFAATAYEIDDFTLDNLEKYNIYTAVNDTVKFTPSGGDEPIAPVTQIVFIRDNELFPNPGRTEVLYIYKKQIYIWDEDNEEYILISIPIWNQEDIDYSELQGKMNNLYVDSSDVYQWNNSSEDFEKISVPRMGED